MSGWGFDFSQLSSQLGDLSLSNIGEKVQQGLQQIKEDVEHGLDAQLRAERLGTVVAPEEPGPQQPQPQQESSDAGKPV